MLFRNLLLKFASLSKLNQLNGYENKFSTRQCFTSTMGTPILSRNMSSMPPRTSASNKVSTMYGLREFFMHPLTWDRNNGYFNILLGMAIFGYCFCTACAIDKPDNVSYEVDNKK